jgi:hypothetical protein
MEINLGESLIRYVESPLGCATLLPVKVSRSRNLLFYYQTGNTKSRETVVCKLYIHTCCRQGCDRSNMTNDFFCVTFAIRMTRALPRMTRAPKAADDWYPTLICDEFVDAVKRLFHDQSFAFDFDLADGRITIRIRRPISIEEATDKWRALRTYVYEHPFMVKEEIDFKDWYSPYDGAWFMKIDESKFNVHELGELLKETGIVATRSYTRWEHGRGRKGRNVCVFATGLLKCSGDYYNDCWRNALREALGNAVKLMSPDETIERVSCELEPVGSEQHALLLILKASSVLDLQMANNMIGEEEV